MRVKAIKFTGNEASLLLSIAVITMILGVIPKKGGSPPRESRPAKINILDRFKEGINLIWLIDFKFTFMRGTTTEMVIVEYTEK
jgi:hypothetical protein